jgi:hypothetical protein
MNKAVPPNLCMPPWCRQDNFLFLQHITGRPQGILRELSQSYIKKEQEKT